jgi:MFS family permease
LPVIDVPQILNSAKPMALRTRCPPSMVAPVGNGESCHNHMNLHGGERLKVRRVFGNRNARIYISGQSLAFVGSNTLWLAMGIWVKILTGSNTAAGLTFFAYICGLLLAPIAGMIVDRVRRLRLMICVDLLAAAWICTLFLVSGRGEVWVIYLVMFGYGALSSVIMSGQTALLAYMLPEDAFGDANSILQIAEQGVRVVTPLIGAGLLTLAGPKPVILLDAGTYLAAGLALLTIRLQEPRPEPSGEHWLTEALAGIRLIRKTPELSRLLVGMIVTVQVFGYFITIPYAVAGSGLHRPPAFVGVLEAVSGAGALAAGLLAAPVMRRIGEPKLIASGLVTCAAGAICLTTHWLPVVLLGMITPGICIVWVNVGAFTLIQLRTPQSLIGRVDAALNVSIMVPQAVSVATGALLVAAVNYRWLLVAMAIILGLGAFVMTGKPRQDSQAILALAAETDAAE